MRRDRVVAEPKAQASIGQNGGDLSVAENGAETGHFEIVGFVVNDDWPMQTTENDADWMLLGAFDPWGMGEGRRTVFRSGTVDLMAGGTVVGEESLSVMLAERRFGGRTR